MQGKGGGAPLWSVAVHWVCRLWSLLGSARQDQLPPVFCPIAQHELQSNLQMPATCAGLRHSQVKPSCEPRLAAASARLGTI